MLGYLARRLLMLPVVLAGISALSFALIHLAPGDPAEVLLRAQQPGIEPSREAVVTLRRELGLDDPAILRFGRWLLSAAQGDLGTSFRSGRPIAHELLERLPATLSLAIASLTLAIAAAVPLGVLAAVHRGSPLDTLSRILALLGAAVPSYIVALALVLVLAVNLRWLPSIGFGEPRHLILPMIALSFGTAAHLMRLTRASVLEVLDQDYIQTARMKGLSEPVVIGVHALKNALLPVVTMLGVSVGHLLGGAVIVETIFGWPGVGKYAVDAIFLRDYPAIQGFVLYAAVVVVLLNLLVDISYRWLDPRLHFERS